jgi:hypothetical protein
MKLSITPLSFLMANPVFVIHVYNILADEVKLYRRPKPTKYNFVRRGILPIDSIQFTAFSPNESVLYYSNYSKLYKYNYTTNSVEGSTELNSSIVFVKVLSLLLEQKLLLIQAAK